MRDCGSAVLFATCESPWNHSDSNDFTRASMSGGDFRRYGSPGGGPPPRQFERQGSGGFGGNRSPGDVRRGGGAGFGSDRGGSRSGSRGGWSDRGPNRGGGGGGGGFGGHGNGRSGGMHGGNNRHGGHSGGRRGGGGGAGGGRRNHGGGGGGGGGRGRRGHKHQQEEYPGLDKFIATRKNHIRAASKQDRPRVLNVSLLFTASRLKVPSCYESAARFILWLIDENDPGPNINAQNKDNFTVLHYAVFVGPIGADEGPGFGFRKLFIRSLLSHGAEVMVTNNFKETAVDAARKGNLKNHPKECAEIVKMLEDHVANRTGGLGTSGEDHEEYFAKAVKRMVNMINTDNSDDIHRIVKLRDTARAEGVPITDKATHTRKYVKLENVRKKWSIKKIIELVWENAVGDASIFGSASDAKKGSKKGSSGKGSRTVAMQYCQLFAALRDANPGFEVVDYVIQVGMDMLLARVNPDLKDAAERDGDDKVAEQERKKKAGIKVQDVVRVGVVNLFISDSRAKMRNLCKFAALLVLRNFLPVHSVVRGIFAPLNDEIARMLGGSRAGRPYNALLCAGALVDMMEMLQEFRQDARFVALMLNSSLTLQAAMQPMIEADSELSGPVGRLAYAFSELMGKLYAWRTGKARGLSRNAADGPIFQRGGGRFGGGGGPGSRFGGSNGGGGSRFGGGRFGGSSSGSGDVRAYRPPGAAAASAQRAEEEQHQKTVDKKKEPVPRTPGAAPIPVTVTEAQEWTPADAPGSRKAFLLQTVLKDMAAVAPRGGPKQPSRVSADMQSRVVNLVTLTVMQPIEDVAESPELAAIRKALTTADPPRQTWMVVRLLAYASQWPLTDTRVQSKFACLLQQIKASCQPRVYAGAVAAAVAHRFPDASMQKQVAAVSRLAESGDFQKKIEDMFDNATRARLRAVFRALGTTVSATAFASKAVAAAMEPGSTGGESLSNKKMTALVYELLQFLVAAPRAVYQATTDHARSALEHMLHSEAIDADMISAARESIKIDAGNDGNEEAGPDDDALSEVAQAVEQSEFIGEMVRQLTLTPTQRTAAALSAFFEVREKAYCSNSPGVGSGEPQTPQTPNPNSDQATAATLAAVAPLRECVAVLARAYQNRPKTEAEQAVAELFVREALSQFTQAAQCVALTTAFAEDEELRSMVSAKAMDAALQAVAGNLGVIEQVNPAASAMLRYLRDPSQVEADAQAAKLEAAKLLRGQWLSKVRKFGQLTRAGGAPATPGSPGAPGAEELLAAVGSGVREYPPSDRAPLFLELLCTAVENVSNPEAQKLFTASMRCVVRDGAVDVAAALDEDGAEILNDMVVDVPLKEQDQARAFVQELLALRSEAPSDEGQSVDGGPADQATGVAESAGASAAAPAAAETTASQAATAAAAEKVVAAKAAAATAAAEKAAADDEAGAKLAAADKAAAELATIGQGLSQLSMADEKTPDVPTRSEQPLTATAFELRRDASRSKSGFERQCTGIAIDGDKLVLFLQGGQQDKQELSLDRVSLAHHANSKGLCIRTNSGQPTPEGFVLQSIATLVWMLFIVVQC